MTAAGEQDAWRPTYGSISRSVAEALAAADLGGDAEVRVPIVLAARVHGWGPLAHRLSVAGRALAFDLGADRYGQGLLDTRAIDDRTMSEITWCEPFERVAAVRHLTSWADGVVARPDHTESDVWTMLVAVDFLRRRLGYPPPIVA